MAGVYELVTSLHNSGGNFFQNVFKYDLNETGSGTSPWEYAKDLALHWGTAVKSHYLKLFGTDVSLDFYTAKKVNSGGGPSASVIDGSFGTGAGVSVTTGASGDVQWQSASPLNRPGHTYLAAFADGMLQQDAFQAPYTTDIITWGAAMLAPLTLTGTFGTAIFGIYSRKTDSFHPATNGILRPKATMMNRRLLPQI